MQLTQRWNLWGGGVRGRDARRSESFAGSQSQDFQYSNWNVGACVTECLDDHRLASRRCLTEHVLGDTGHRIHQGLHFQHCVHDGCLLTLRQWLPDCFSPSKRSQQVEWVGPSIQSVGLIGFVGGTVAAPGDQVSPGSVDRTER